MAKTITLLVAFALLSLVSLNANALECYQCLGPTCSDPFSFENSDATTCEIPNNGVNLKGMCIVCIFV